MTHSFMTRKYDYDNDIYDNDIHIEYHCIHYKLILLMYIIFFYSQFFSINGRLKPEEFGFLSNLSGVVLLELINLIPFIRPLSKLTKRGQ